MKHITTTDLNAAAYIQLHGFQVKVSPIKYQDCNFRFLETKETQNLLEKFLKGKVEVNLAAFMWTRQTLKREGNVRLATKTGTTKKVSLTAVEPPFMPLKNCPYWYRGTDGHPTLTTYMGSEVDEERIREGNCYRQKRFALRVSVV